MIILYHMTRFYFRYWRTCGPGTAGIRVRVWDRGGELWDGYRGSTATTVWRHGMERIRLYRNQVRLKGLCLHFWHTIMPY